MNKPKKRRYSSRVSINQTSKVERFKSVTAIVGLVTAVITLIGTFVAIIPKSSGDKPNPSVQIQNTIHFKNDNSRAVLTVSESHKKTEKIISAAGVFELTAEEIKQINDAKNDCIVGLFSRASDKFEEVARRFINSPNADKKSLNRARFATKDHNQSACKYYMKFFEPFYNPNERMIKQ